MPEESIMHLISPIMDDYRMVNIKMQQLIYGPYDYLKYMHSIDIDRVGDKDACNSILSVIYNQNDFYFWMADKYNPRKKAYFMIKRLKRIPCRKNQ